MNVNCEAVPCQDHHQLGSSSPIVYAGIIVCMVAIIGLRACVYHRVRVSTYPMSTLIEGVEADMYISRRYSSCCLKFKLI
jgi:hypothetical protein